MSSKVPYPPNSDQNQQQPNQYPPPPMANYGSAYPPPMNQGAYPPPVQNIPSGNPAYPPPPSYDSSVGQPTPNPYGPNYSYPMPSAPPPSYPPPSSDVAFPSSNAAYHDRIISFDDKTIRLGMFVWVKLTFLFRITLFSLFYWFKSLFHETESVLPPWRGP